MIWFYIVFSALCFVGAAAYGTDHARHHVPGLLFFAIVIALEGVEYLWIAIAWGDLPTIYFKNLITSFRMFLLLGFWLGVRYGERPLREVRRPDHAVALAVEGYIGFFDRMMRQPWAFFRSGFERVRAWHKRKSKRQD